MQILFWRILVIIFLISAIIGFIVPGVPVTVFLILATWAASKGWPEVEQWLLNHPKYGTSIRQWREHGTIPRKVKWIACLMMLVSAIILLLTPILWWIKASCIAIMSMVAVWLCLRPEQPQPTHPPINTKSEM